MDNAPRAWELPFRSMRNVVALIVALAILSVGRWAFASEARRAVEDANTALSAQPPRPERRARRAPAGHRSWR